jgi:hypothetical protein
MLMHVEDIRPAGERRAGGHGRKLVGAPSARANTGSTLVGAGPSGHGPRVCVRVLLGRRRHYMYCLVMT